MSAKSEGSEVLRFVGCRFRVDQNQLGSPKEEFVFRV